MTLNWTYEGTASGDATMTVNSALSFTPTGSGVSPALILGPVNNRPAVAAVGHSIPDGAGDSGLGNASEAYGNIGFISRACAGNVGLSKLCFPGRRVAQEIAPSAYRSRGALVMQPKNIVSMYLTNDVGFGDSVATMQANIITFWKFFANTGRRVFECTVTPLTNGPWTSVAAQTVRTYEANRLASMPGFARVLRWSTVWPLRSARLALSLQAMQATRFMPFSTLRLRSR